MVLTADLGDGKSLISGKNRYDVDESEIFLHGGTS